MKRLSRENDCKLKVEKALSLLGYKTYPKRVGKIETKEAVVLYTNLNIELASQESYTVYVDISIIINIDDNNDLPYVIMDIIGNVTDYVEQQSVSSSTSIHFTHVNVLSGEGETLEVEIVGTYYMELDWVTDHNFCGNT